MPTSAFIGKSNPDGSIEGVYCRWDGYISGLGKRLIENYDSLEHVEEILSLGDMSNLGKDLSPMCTEAYHRDKNEKLNPPKRYRDGKRFASKVWKDFSANFAYVFFPDIGWTVATRSQQHFESLKIAVLLRHD